MPDAADALKKASQGLTYESETDAPFTVFAWKVAGGRLTRKRLLELGNQGLRTPVEELTLDDFFGDLTQDAGWHGPQEKADAQKYRQLLRTINEQLSGAKVYKVGDTQKTIYIVGKTASGDWVGLQTKAVET